jgi:hypothetical protein
MIVQPLFLAGLAFVNETKQTELGMPSAGSGPAASTSDAFLKSLSQQNIGESRRFRMSLDAGLTSYPTCVQSSSRKRSDEFRISGAEQVRFSTSSSRSVLPSLPADAG